MTGAKRFRGSLDGGRLLLLVCLIACAGGPRPRVFERILAARNDAERAAAQSASPALFAKADQLRARAEAAAKASDTATSELLGDHAVAAYRHAVAIARLTAARTRQSRAQLVLRKASEAADADAKSYVEIDREASRLEAELSVRREALVPVSSGATTASREAARWVVSRVNLSAAQATCEGAGLLAPEAKGLPDARKVLATLAAEVESAKKEAPIDLSARARSLCLKALVSARDTVLATGGPSGESFAADLVAEGFVVARDERGVVVTLAQAPSKDSPEAGSVSAPFEPESAKLTKWGLVRLEALGRLAKARATFAVLIVAQGGVAARNQERADIARKTLVSTMSDAARASVLSAAPGAPGKAEGKPGPRAERLEVIFVGPR